ncbi:MAG: cytochrome c biogenesis protein CcsA, partial [Acidobacteriota bacterium]
IAAFWAGQKGSFLIWLLFGALLGLPLSRAAGRDEAPVMGVYLLTLCGLLFILVRENPFVMLPQAPVDGAGLNPLLQDDWMVIHPPIMFVGYAAAAIPFSFAMAAMWRRDTSSWAQRAFPWALMGFLVLGLAILLGGYWAYKTLGWGGYWGWDPVENASLIPWLFGVALVHGLYLERTQKRYRRMNLVLAVLMYLAVLYGTFLTRSGVLADFSVHSFVDLGISSWLVALMTFFIVSSLYLLITRLPKITSPPNEDPMLSRGFFLVVATVTVLLSTAVITVGTSAPLLTRFMENPGQVGPSFYNTVNMPLALLVVLLLAAVPFVTWRGTPAPVLMRQMIPGLLGAVAITAIAMASGVTRPLHVLFIFLSAAALATNLHKVASMIRTNGLGRAGGYLAHVGVGVIFIGFMASTAYDQSTKLTLEQGEPAQVGELTLTFERFVPRQGREKESMEVTVARADGRSYKAYPKLFVNDRTRQLMANPDVRTTPLQDIYISPIQYDPGEPPTIEQRIALRPGEVTRAGDLEVRFVDFDLADNQDVMTQFASGRTVNVGAELQVRHLDTWVPITTVYRFQSNGVIEAPPTALPGGGLIQMTRIEPTTGAVQLEIAGRTTSLEAPSLSIDITRKPLIQLVWLGLYIVLAGGALSTVHRYRQARKVDAMAA